MSEPRYVVLYDGQCKFCIAQTRNLVALARRDALELVDFQQPGVLDRYPSITYDACMQAMHLITPEGQIYKGFEAAVHAVATRPLLGKLAYVYYLPGLRQLCDLAYRLIANYRYRLLGKKVAEEGCDGGTCSLHFSGAHEAPTVTGVKHQQPVAAPPRLP